MDHAGVDRRDWAVALAGLGLGLAALCPLPALAQATGTSEVRLTILDPVAAGVGDGMHFGEITPTGTNGTVVLAPGATATCTVTGGLIRGGLCRAARFTGTGTYQTELRVQRPSGNRIDLVGPGGATMRLDDFVFAATPPTTFVVQNGANTRFNIGAPDGSFEFFAGGTLHVAGNQAPGHYIGTFEIRLFYN